MMVRNTHLAIIVFNIMLLKILRVGLGGQLSQ